MPDLSLDISCVDPTQIAPEIVCIRRRRVPHIQQRMMEK